jgi:hypothetical protein
MWQWPTSSLVPSVPYQENKHLPDLIIQAIAGRLGIPTYNTAVGCLLYANGSAFCLHTFSFCIFEHSPLCVAVDVRRCLQRYHGHYRSIASTSVCHLKTTIKICSCLTCMQNSLTQQDLASCHPLLQAPVENPVEPKKNDRSPAPPTLATCLAPQPLPCLHFGTEVFAFLCPTSNGIHIFIAPTVLTCTHSIWSLLPLQEETSTSLTLDC